MNEVMQIRAASWAAMIKQRNDSGLTIREWCAANGIQESVYYYRLNRLRKMALDVEETPRVSEILCLWKSMLPWIRVRYVEICCRV